MNLHRLGEMGLDEIVVRSRQEARKWIDRTGAKHRGQRAAPPWATQCSPGIASGPFFESASGDGLARIFAARMPAARNECLNAANAAYRHQFDLLGYAGLSFGNPIDWHFDPVSGRHAPLRHWSLINPLDSAVLGDAKVIWELSRHQWLVRLGQAYRLNRDERYADAFARDVGAWLDANPPGMGINWASSLEVALRLMSWCWSLSLFRDSTALTPRLRDRIVDGIAAHAAHVERYLSYYFSPNTHLTGEALGLFYAGVLLSGHRQSRRWQSLGARILVEQCERHVLPDGVYFEQAIGYERYTLEFYLHFLILSERAGQTVPPAVTERVHRMLDFLLAIRRPDGSLPQIGDADSGSLLPLTPRAQHDFRGVFSVAAALLGRTDCAWAAGGITPEIAWLLGPPGIAAFDDLASAPPAKPPSRCFSDGGYVVMQDGWDPRRHQIGFDTGPIGCSLTSGHGHADLLSVQCSVFGEPYLVDAGTFSYSDAVGRRFFRETAAHSTVMVDDAPQACSTGPFRWSQRPGATLRDWRTSSALDYADAQHAAFRRLTGSMVHRRRVVFVKSKYWVITDDITGTGSHTVDLRFQFAPLDVSVDVDGRAIARGRQGHGLLIRPFASVALGARVSRGTLDPMQGWISDEYGRREPAPVLVYSATAELPLRIISVLVPLADADAIPAEITPVFDPREDGAVVGVRFEDGERVLFDEDGVQFQPQSVFPRLAR